MTQVMFAQGYYFVSELIPAVLSVATNSEKSDYAYWAPTSCHITYWLFSIKFLKICKIGISLIFIYGEAKVSFESYLYDFKDLYG